MSQFMLCQSKKNLEKLGCVKLINYSKKDFFIKVALKYFEENVLDELWIFEKIDKYCTEAQKCINEDILFENTRLYSLLKNLYNNCLYIIFWYGNDFLNLENIINYNNFFEYIIECIREPRCEIYLKLKIK